MEQTANERFRDNLRRLRQRSGKNLVEIAGEIEKNWAEFAGKIGPQLKVPLAEKRRLRGMGATTAAPEFPKGFYDWLRRVGSERGLEAKTAANAVQVLALASYFGIEPGAFWDDPANGEIADLAEQVVALSRKREIHISDVVKRLTSCMDSIFRRDNSFGDRLQLAWAAEIDALSEEKQRQLLATIEGWFADGLDQETVLTKVGSELQKLSNWRTSPLPQND